MAELRPHIFDNPGEAAERANEIGCSGYHTHDDDGNEVFMPCATHEEFQEIVEEDMWHDEEEEDSWHKPKKELEQMDELYEKAPAKYSHINFKPTPAMAAEGKRGLEWRKEFNRGGTMVGVARGQQLKNRENLSPSVVKRMYSYLRRHEVDKQAEGFRPGEKGFPSAGRIAWALWGGDPAVGWASKRVKQMEAADKKDKDQTYIFDARLNAGNFTVKYPDEDKKDIIIEGPVSSAEVDRDGDIVDPAAVLAAWPNYRKNPIIRFNHGREGIGLMTDVYMGTDEDGNHLPIGRALIDGNETKICNKIKKGIYRSFSIGFRVEAKEQYDDEGKKRLKFTKIDWVETSVVDVPSNRKAIFSVVKTPSNGIFSKYLAEDSKTLTYDELMRLNETANGEFKMTDENIESKSTNEEATIAAILDTTQEKVQMNKSDVDNMRKELEELNAWKAAQIAEEEALKAKAAKDAEIEAAITEAKSAHEEEIKLLTAQLEEAKAAAVAEVPDRAPDRKSLVDTTPTEIISGAYPDGKDALTVLCETQNKTPGTVLGELWLLDKLGDRIGGNY